jgi:hypothetical protein
LKDDDSVTPTPSRHSRKMGRAAYSNNIRLFSYLVTSLGW